MIILSARLLRVNAQTAPPTGSGSLKSFGILYNQQNFVSFTQKKLSINYTVTATIQPEDPFGAAYFINGLTDKDFWYQVGITRDWPGGSYNNERGKFVITIDLLGPDG